ncbi:hypothetical protein [Methylosinus trichosporium]|uniref:Uncharacterized protein n=1 Tax=Methylosinus trichosporium (strain ATCC 35070 / NCIMB 11131 / UNIQEM 75 / OB3b) TaxID=595536 RepID=A0A2D2D6U8_METT3|nr:hypothetical protein [Methylosinus trichosporium]ATQ70703.1 hypothetical protein CQW49_22270 [Methylosinus trichosporium OB3b]OBS54498.1 hypothetical protein A8B73_00225 [Methylosinus sp. 3S-1]
MRLFIEHRFVSNVSIEKEDARRFSRAWQFAREQPASKPEPFGQFFRRTGIRAEGRSIVIFDVAEEVLA